LLGAVLIGWYVRVTPYNSRTHDIGSHLAYIQRTEDRGGIPRDTDCWECHQPFGYYGLAAAVLLATGSPLPDEHAPADKGGPGARALQGLAGALGLGTLAFWLMTIRLALATRYERVVASALVTFWPTLAIEGCKVGNDPLVYLLASGAVWQLVSWRRTGSPISLIAAGAFAGASASAKVNGLVVVAIFLGSLGLAVLRPRTGDRRWPRGATAALAIHACFLGAWLYVLGRYKSWTTHPDFASIGGNLHQTNDLRDFVSFHLDSFDSPWVQSGAGPARDELWNYLLRSSLFGEYATNDPTTKVCAFALINFVLAFVPFLVAGLLACMARGLSRTTWATASSRSPS
jgi:hypothetical protein